VSAAYGELQKKKFQRVPKTTTGRVFPSVRTTPGVSFVTALRGSGDQQQQPQAKQVPVANPPTKVKHNIPAPALQQTTGQSVQNHVITIGNRYFENVAQFRYLGMTTRNQNLIQEEIKRLKETELR
jgi:hypothetical protein